MDKGVSRNAVCVLDDDPSVLKAVGRLLKSEGFEVTKFSEPAAFLTAMHQSPCPVAVLDFAMPRMNGLEVQAILRRTAPETRVIFFSGHGDDVVREMALQKGAVAFLDKPCDDEELLGAVRQALNGHNRNGATEDATPLNRNRERDFFGPSDLGMSPG